MNLLPKTEKETLKEGLKSRFIIVASFLVAASFLMGFIMLLPSYFLTLVSSLEGTSGNNYPGAENKDSIEKILNLPEEINSKLKFFQSNINNVSVADSFYKITSHLPGGVTLNSVSFSRNQVYKEKTGTAILISGTAFDRDSLISFSTNLKDSNSFSSVEVPVSSLTRDRNLPFSMNIFIENQK
jgi:hypothetical protein